MTMRAVRTLAIAALALGVPTIAAASCAPSPPPQIAAGREPAHPAVSGAAGPFRHSTLTLTRPSGVMGGPFSGVLDTGGGKRMTLAGPDEPADLFLVDVTAVLFTPIAGGRINGIVILYNSSQIGPGNGTEHKALVYRVEAARATRQPAIEARLEGAANAAAVRRRLAAGHRR